ncbi:hypothetical protein [Haloferula sp. BvORR071]|uniref:hypothetical protein n=1 Tax=Haloferula sp. BvORR071 TaxID=1396141 RepID=UPI00224101B1|nr:hypothetical protein [Haloferula sp. BvORR071]
MSSSAPADEAAELLAKLRGYAERGAARDQKEAAETGPDEETRLAEIRARLTADPNSDVVAMVLAGTANPNAEIPLESYAAFGVWLDRDPLAAIRWFGKFAKDQARGKFDEELWHHFTRSGFGQLEEMMAAAGIGRDAMMGSIHAALEDRKDRDELLRVAAMLKSGSERVDLFNSIMGSPEELAGNLAAIRTSLGDADAILFLSKIWDSKGALDLLGELHATGFPPDIVERFETEAKKAAAKESKSAAGGDDIVWTDPDGQSEADTELWQGSIGPQEYYERLKDAAGPDVSDASLLQMVFSQMMQVDPRAGMAWAQKSVPDWGTAFTTYMTAKPDSVPVPEMLATIAAQAWADGLPQDRTGLNKIESSFAGIYRDDPEAWRDAVGKLPAGPLRQALEQSAVGEDEEDGR